VDRERMMKKYMSVKSMLEKEPQKRHRYVSFLFTMRNQKNMERKELTRIVMARKSVTDTIAMKPTTSAMKFREPGKERLMRIRMSTVCLEYQSK
jgi:CO dehydrogenase/acetyl-CoA synthase delta subunit